MNKIRKLVISLFAVFFFVVFVYAISLPLYTPQYKTTGGEMKKVFHNISQSCESGKYLQGFTSSGGLICKDLGTLSTLSLSAGENNYTLSGMGKYTSYFYNILNNCGNGRYLRGFNADKKMICSDKNGVDTIMGDAFPYNSIPSVLYPSISLGIPKYTQYLENIVSNICGVNQSITGFDENGIKLGCQTMIVNGVCGSANANLTSIKPTTDLCSAGNPSVISGSGTWVWNCNGLNGGITSVCAAGNATYYSTSLTPVSAHGGVKITPLGNHKHCVISRLYGDLEQSAWKLWQLSSDQNVCVKVPLFPFTTDGNGNTVSNPCKKTIAAKKGDWFIRIDDEGGSEVARAGVMCTDESPGTTGNFLLGGLCNLSGHTGIINNSGCCVVGSQGKGNKHSVVTGDFATNCNF